MKYLNQLPEHHLIQKRYITYNGIINASPDKLFPPNNNRQEKEYFQLTQFNYRLYTFEDVKYNVQIRVISDNVTVRLVMRPYFSMTPSLVLSQMICVCTVDYSVQCFYSQPATNPQQIVAHGTLYRPLRFMECLNAIYQQLRLCSLTAFTLKQDTVSCISCLNKESLCKGIIHSYGLQLSLLTSVCVSAQITVTYTLLHQIASDLFVCFLIFLNLCVQYAQ